MNRLGRKKTTVRTTEREGNDARRTAICKVSFDRIAQKREAGNPSSDRWTHANGDLTRRNTTRSDRPTDRHVTGRRSYVRDSSGSKSVQRAQPLPQTPPQSSSSRHFRRPDGKGTTSTRVPRLDLRTTPTHTPHPDIVHLRHNYSPVHARLSTASQDRWTQTSRPTPAANDRPTDRRVRFEVVRRIDSERLQKTPQPPVRINPSFDATSSRGRSADASTGGQYRWQSHRPEVRRPPQERPWTSARHGENAPWELRSPVALGANRGHRDPTSWNGRSVTANAATAPDVCLPSQNYRLGRKGPVAKDLDGRSSSPPDQSLAAERRNRLSGYGRRFRHASDDRRVEVVRPANFNRPDGDCGNASMATPDITTSQSTELALQTHSSVTHRPLPRNSVTASDDPARDPRSMMLPISASTRRRRLLAEGDTKSRSKDSSQPPSLEK